MPLWRAISRVGMKVPTSAFLSLRMTSESMPVLAMVDLMVRPSSSLVVSFPSKRRVFSSVMTRVRCSLLSLAGAESSGPAGSSTWRSGLMN